MEQKNCQCTNSDNCHSEKKKKIVNCLKCKSKSYEINIRENYPLCK